ncbi:hypothetical protein HZS_1067 [Henneguya salminicola]|nr:hypothetical protein HZS_1067 [Henneguya salminicola]
MFSLKIKRFVQNKNFWTINKKRKNSRKLDELNQIDIKTVNFPSIMALSDAEKITYHFETFHFTSNEETALTI